MPPKTKKVKKTKKIRTIPEQGISKPAIMRILYRAGVKSTSSLVYQQMREISMSFLRRVVKRSILYSNNRKKTTIAEKDVINALKTLGFTYLSPGGSGSSISGISLRIYKSKTKANSKKRSTPKKNKGTGSRKSRTEGGTIKPHRFKSGTVALRSIRRYQKSTELLLRKSPIKDIIRFLLNEINITTKYLNIVGSEFRIGKTARDAFHTCLEYHLVSIASRALILSLNSKRTRLQVSDVKIVTKMI